MNTRERVVGAVAAAMTVPREPEPLPSPSAELLDRIHDAAGTLSSLALQQLTIETECVQRLSAAARADIGVIIQRLILDCVDWCRHGGNWPVKVTTCWKDTSPTMVHGLSVDESVQVITKSLLIMQRMITALEDDQYALSLCVSAYTQQMALSCAQWCASLAEERSRWDVQKETALVDAVVRGAANDIIDSLCATISWNATSPVQACVATPRTKHDTSHDAAHSDAYNDPVEVLRRHARQLSLRLLATVHGRHIVFLVEEGKLDLMNAECPLYKAFSDDHIVVSPVAHTMAEAHEAVQECLASLRVVRVMPLAPRILTSHSVLPERAISGDPLAVQRLRSQVIVPLHKKASHAIRETLSLYLSVDGGVEECARLLYIHPNTVRYRLKRIADITGLEPLDSRERFMLRIANVLGMLEYTDEDDLPSSTFAGQ